MTDATIQTLDTPDGPFTVLEDAEGRVLASGWTDQADRVLARIAERYRPGRVLDGRVASADAVDAFYAGELEHAMQVPVRQAGTELFAEGWRQLRNIPAGSVLTYREFAAAMGRPDAVRAAASVCARNAPALFVPCHRVLRSDGTLGGFAWGLDVKRSLLERESVGTTALV
ncbi:methylated-DNA-[protein]-cysteine S-methyltransferase [Curtobacterium luteum]|uniref:Methylated-DNA-[protein]-cysteine S-methyltransferase n=1 Tax=Curtobacterium luteum TaxID=33881 RepID=A0A8H9G7T6_9MICO|nr:MULTISPECIES: methylated-DNA--[protein]-cysteine S-methyltransferase [Curtobacterium]MBM7803142.1 methylated-DNA-[protein]-cysteine S-methyltransferase [Curtobacterium luteum]NUU50793.1 methylated-DNA--[protein]-cysteine S-methyltransferase [Curtobacterium luteum]GGK94397.1 putative methylated-DNA:protein-cysteine methyltransferase [Curtobacterium luteum]